jgi:hypothetical protein
VKLNQGSPRSHKRGVSQLSTTIAEVLRGYLIASVTMDVGVGEAGFDRAIESFVGAGVEVWHLPPAQMLDFADNNFADAIRYLESARTKIANAAIEALAPELLTDGEVADFDTKLEDLLREEDEET